MTDNEIVKALEYWKQFDKDIDTLQSTHPQYADMWDKQKEVVKITLEVFEEVNRQKAEVERLKIENKLLIENDISNKYPNCVLVEKGRIYTRTLEDYDELIGDISAEAYREFAEKFEERIAVHLLRNKSNEYADGFADALDGVNEEIDNILKELVGGD